MKKAFTLIEMLVVIAIIAILAALLMPAIARARKEAYKVHCTNNQHQVAQYFAMYRNDNRSREVWNNTYGYQVRYDYGRLPSWAINLGDRDGDGIPEWGYDSSLSLARLYPDYADTHEVFLCAAADHKAELTRADVNLNSLDFDGDPDTVEYRFETLISEANDPDYLIDPHVPTNCKSSRVIYGDGPDMDHERVVWEANNPGRLFPTRDTGNHEYGSVVLFYDGHTKFLRFSDVFGRLENPEIRDYVGIDTDDDGDIEGDVVVDPDVYADDDHDNHYSAHDFDDDEAADCDLGNYIDYRGAGVDWKTDAVSLYFGEDGDPYWAGPGDELCADPGYTPVAPTASVGYGDVYPVE